MRHRSLVGVPGAGRGRGRRRAGRDPGRARRRAGCAARTWPGRRWPSRSGCRRWRTSSRRSSAARTASSVNPPTPPSWLGANFPLERWEAWIACAGALVVVFVLYNVSHSAVGRSWRAVRDDEIAASLAGLRVGRRQTLAFAMSAACAGLGGGLLAVVTQLGVARRLPVAAVADAARRRRDRRAGVARRRASGARRCSCCSRTGPTTSRTRSRCRRTSPTTCRSRSTARADRRDARVAERDPGRRARDRPRACGRRRVAARAAGRLRCAARATEPAKD